METTTQSTAGIVWQKSKWIIKGCIIGLMALLLLVPMIYVKNLILEREQRQKEATAEISSKWAGPQHIAGPVVGIPFLQVVTDTGGKTRTEKHIAWFLPDELNITTEITPTEKHRGIFKVMLYHSKTELRGSFNRLPLEKLKLASENFLWDEAVVKLNLADVRGLNEQLKLKWKDSVIELTPQSAGNARDGMVASVPASSAEDFKNVSFSASIDLNGAGQLMFTPLGRNTTVKVNSKWKDPSFNGGILPQQTTVNDSGFIAVWKSMAHTRGFSQQWTDDAYNLHYRFAQPSAADVKRESYTPVAVDTVPGQTVSTSAAIASSVFGVNLFVPVNGYQKTMRTVKYALLCIVLTFAAFFLIETVQKKSVHPFQYGLIGLALILFYTLLLSFSEYTGFNSAYIISSLATIGLISWFVRSLLQASGPAVILSLVLVLVYSYVFSILQLQDYALIFGSIGLFLMLAIVMYFSRKISW